MKQISEQAARTLIEIFEKSFFGMMETKVIYVLQLSLISPVVCNRLHTLFHNSVRKIVLDNRCRLWSLFYTSSIPLLSIRVVNESALDDLVCITHVPVKPFSIDMDGLKVETQFGPFLVKKRLFENLLVLGFS